MLKVVNNLTQRKIFEGMKILREKSNKLMIIKIAVVFKNEDISFLQSRE